MICKKLFPVLIILPFIFLGGCFEVRVNLEANLDGSGDLEISMKTSRLLMSMGNTAGIIGDIKEDLEQQGFAMQEYARNNEVVFTARKDITSLEELAGYEVRGAVGEAVGSRKDNFVTERGFFTNNYHVDTEINPSNFLSEELSALARLADIKFALSLPVRPSGHNAAAVSEDGKTLEWEICPASVNRIQFSIRTLNYVTLLITLLGLISTITLVFYRKRHKHF